MPLKASYLMLTGAGLIVAVAGMKGWGLSHTFRDVISGKNPAANPQLANQIWPSNHPPGTTPGSPGTTAPPGDTAAHSMSARANQALARLSVAVAHPSWAVGQQWQDWVSLWNQESGWNNLALNGGSGAFGIAQALGHGTPGTGGRYGDQYGADYGLSGSSARAANNGAALPQIQWGISYIAAVYGSPSQAWAHETANGWY